MRIKLVCLFCLIFLPGEVHAAVWQLQEASLDTKPRPKGRVLTNEDFQPPPPLPKPEPKPKPVERPQLGNSSWPHLDLAESCEPGNVSLLHQLTDLMGRYNRTIIDQIDNTVMFLWRRPDGDFVLNMDKETITFLPKNMTLADALVRYGFGYERKDSHLHWSNFKNRHLSIELSRTDSEKVAGIVFSKN
ncbi:MAG: hypothetical protein AB1489_17190 [Acidobacteriota bacterium]